MAMNRARSGVVARRLAGVCAVLVLFAGLAPGAGADTKSQLDAAKARFEVVKDQIARQQAELDRLEAQSALLATKVSEAQGRLQVITQILLDIRLDLEKARERYQTVQGRLDQRALETYMSGPGSSLEFLLGATSLIDLSDRLEFVDVMTQTDSDLANEVQNLKNDLSAQLAKQEELQAEQARVVNRLRDQQAELNARFDQQRDIYNDILAKQREAEDLVERLGRKYKRELAAAFGGPIGDGPIKICPVGQPHAGSDSFGAPRVGHLHAGNDIFAPYGTQIFATFDGVATNSSNGLGGNAVVVRGSEGWTYNAHMSSFGKLGSVQTGDVIGYVGTSGNAQGTSPHNHFEWHPNVIPSNWPASPYGYSVLGDAINPYPLLAAVC